MMYVCKYAGMFVFICMYTAYVYTDVYVYLRTYVYVCVEICMYLRKGVCMYMYVRM